MGGSIWFDIFILVNVFLIGALTATAVRHAYAHYRPHPDEKKYQPNVSTIRMNPEVRERLLKEAEVHFQRIVADTSQRLHNELDATTKKLGQNLDALGSSLLEDEMSRFKKDITLLRERTETTIEQTEKVIAQHEKEVDESIAAQQKAIEDNVTAETQKHIAKRAADIDTKLSDAVMALLDEALQHNVDLGAQSEYLLARLEEHKNDLKKDIGA